MLFDLRGRRRNFIRVIYAMLAILMGGGLILFGIGGEVSGGLLDGLGVGGDGDTAGFEDQIDEAEKAVAANPQNPAALLELARVRVSAGTAELDVDQETGLETATTESKQEFEKAADAWDRYLKVAPGAPSPEVAVLISKAYVSLAESATNAEDALSNIQAAADAQQIVADATPSQGSVSQLAIFLYFAGDTAGAEKAAAQAESLAQPAQKQQLKQQLAQFKKRGAEFQKALADARKQAQEGAGAGAGAPGAPAQDPFENPLGGSGGGLSGGALGAP